MNLKEKVVAKLTEAMKSRNLVQIETFRMLKAQILEFEKSGTLKTLTEADESAILNVAVKKRKESIEQFQKANRLELVEKEQAELNIIYEFMPPQLSEIEAREIIQKLISTLSPEDSKSFPKIMSLAMKELKGKIDGKTINSIVKEITT